MNALERHTCRAAIALGVYAAALAVCRCAPDAYLAAQTACVNKATSKSQADACRRPIQIEAGQIDGGGK